MMNGYEVPREVAFRNPPPDRLRQVPITPASRPKRKPESLHPTTCTNLTLNTVPLATWTYNPAFNLLPIMSTAARRRLMRDFKVRHPCNTAIREQQQQQQQQQQQDDAHVVRPC
jgi:hypothetical protein